VAAAGRGLTDWRAESGRDRQPCLWGRDRQDMEFSSRLSHWCLYVSAQCKEKAEEENGKGENEGK
jgi:hypothetical protein